MGITLNKPSLGTIFKEYSLMALGMFLTTECAIADIPEPAPAMPAGAGMGGMM